MLTTGWIPDLPDHRDYEYSQLRPQHRLLKAIARPRASYLHDDQLPRVYNQGNTGSCVGHGCVEGAAYCLDHLYAPGDGKKPGDYSRLFAYYNARRDKLHDTGAYIRDGVKGVATYGVCDESLWPYVESNFAVKPPQAAYDAAAKHAQNVAYFRINRLGDMLDCIAQGFPIVYGMTLFESFFDTGADGVMPLPSRDDSPAGGHCMLIIGYSQTKKAFFVRNSWGADWGLNGNLWVPFEYIEANGDDFWTIRRLSKG